MKAEARGEGGINPDENAGLPVGAKNHSGGASGTGSGGGWDASTSGRGMADFVGGLPGWSRKVELYSEIAVFAPAEVKVEPAALVGKERQQGQFAPGHLKVPAAMRTGISLRIFTAPHEFLVGNSDDVIIEIVERIAKVPLCHPLLVLRFVPCRRHRLVEVFEPPDRVELLVGIGRAHV